VLQHRRPEFRAVPAMVIEEVLPVVRFDELAACVGGDCAVCLSGIGGGDEVRRLSNCRHAFHRGCLDRWMEHDQRTCPLCRAPLIPDEMAGALWAAAAGVPDASDFDFFYSYFATAAPPSPTLCGRTSCCSAASAEALRVAFSSVEPPPSTHLR